MTESETVTIPEREYRYLLYCRDIIESAVRQNVTVLEMTRDLAKKLDLMHEYNLAYEKRNQERKRGRPRKKDKEVEDHDAE